MSEPTPSAQQLMERAARHLAQAAKETDPSRAQQHQEIADVLLKEAEGIVTDGRGSVDGNPSLSQAERHVLEGEQRVAHQLALVNSLDAAGRYEEARAARVLLATLTDTLDAARRHLRIEQRAGRARRPWNLQRRSH